MKAQTVVLYILRNDGLYDVVNARRRSDWPGYLQAGDEWWQTGEDSIGRTYGKPFCDDMRRRETAPSIRHPGPKLFAIGLEGESLLLPAEFEDPQEKRARLIEQTAMRRVVGDRKKERRAEQVQSMLALGVLMGMFILCALFAPTLIERVQETGVIPSIGDEGGGDATGTEDSPIQPTPTTLPRTDHPSISSVGGEGSGGSAGVRTDWPSDLSRSPLDH